MNLVQDTTNSYATKPVDCAVVAMSDHNTWSDLLERDMKRAHKILVFFHFPLIYWLKDVGVYTFCFITADMMHKKVIENGS